MNTSLARESLYDGYSTATVDRNMRPAISWPGIYLIVIGTGGMLASQNIEQLAPRGTSPLIEFRSAAGNVPVDTRSIQDHFTNFCGVFRLKITEVARIFGVTRPAVYGWLAGAEPKPKTKKLILALSRAADRLSTSGTNRPELFVRRPLFDGVSLIELIQSGNPAENALAMIEALANKEMTIRGQASFRHAGTAKRNLDSLDSIATPLITDRG